MRLPHSMKSKAREQFDAWAATYDRSPLHRFLFLPAYQMLLQELYAWRGANGGPFDLLDVGCGTGSFNAMLAESSIQARVVGLDFCPPMCEIAARKASTAGIDRRVHYAAGDSEHLPFADAAFDVVTCSHSFHHYPHQQAVVLEMRRVLRPGGQLLLIDGFRDNIIGWVVFDVIITAVEKQVFHAPWSTIHGYLETAGFREIRRRKFNFWFPTLLTAGTA
jgi:ubiquinone/menaquinone biosynthesis C-methylase UbiE